MFSNKSFPNLSAINKGNINGTTLRNESCGNGFEKIPEKLLPLFNRQVQNNKGSHSALQLSTNVYGEFEFSGYTYTSSIEENLTEQTSNEKPDSGNCEENYDSQRDIVFVSNDVNNIIKRYISRVYANEKKVISTVNFIKAIGENKEAIAEIKLSLAIDVEDEGIISEPKTFKIINDKDVDWARIYADSLLTVNTLNKLRSLKTVAAGSPDTPRNLTDKEITGILSSARLIGIKKTNNID